MSIVEFDGLPSWFLDPSETEESTKCPWVGVVGLIVWGWRGAHRALHYPYPRALCTLLIKRPRWRPVELNDWHLRSHGKKGTVNSLPWVGLCLCCVQVKPNLQGRSDWNQLSCIFCIQVDTYWFLMLRDKRKCSTLAADCRYGNERLPKC